jgi:hypothetical protein
MIDMDGFEIRAPKQYIRLFESGPGGKGFVGRHLSQDGTGLRRRVCVDEGGNLWSNCIDPNGRLLGTRCMRSI